MKLFPINAIFLPFALALFGCSQSEEPLGTLQLPLSVIHGDSTFRFLGTVSILSTEDGSVAATLQSDATSPATHTVSLLPGTYTIEIEDGYACSVAPAAADFTGCTYLDAAPQPFAIAAGHATNVVLTFEFHFDEDVEVAFRTGELVLSLAAVVDASCECGSGELCVSLDGAPEACAATCETQGDCGDASTACFPLSSGSGGVCGPATFGTVWARQFGSNAADYGRSVSADANGNTFVAGYTLGALSGQTSSGASDVFLAKYSADGSLLWTRQFGTSGADFCESVSVDANGNAFVAGYTPGALPGQTSLGGNDAFVAKYSANGSLLWTRQFGTSVLDAANSVSVDASGNAFVAGQTSGALPGQSSAGGSDFFVIKYSADGSLLWTRQLGTTAADGATSVSVDASGNVLVVGATVGALGGVTNPSGSDVLVARYNTDGTFFWARQFGSSSMDAANSVSLDTSGNAIVAGYTSGVLPGQSSAGGNDAFVTKYSASGTLVWTRQFGSSENDSGDSVKVDASGNAFVAGQTSGALSGQPSAGGSDAFVTQYSADGTLLLTRQFGSNVVDDARSVHVDASGNVFLAGYAAGALLGQTSSGDYDAFLFKLSP